MTVKLIPKQQDDDVQYFRYNLNSNKGTVQEDVLGHACSFIKSKDNSHTITQILSACNVYRMDDGKFSHIDGTQFRRSYESEKIVGYDTITSGDYSTYRTLETNSPFVGGLVK